jgi:flagellar biosynthesis component FlhA
MEILETILKFIPLVLGAILAVVSFISAWKAKKKAKEAEAQAKTEEEKAKAEADRAAAELAMEQAAKEFISQAETMYNSVDAILKAKGESAGALKKETVLAKLRTYAIENGITIDVVAWSDKIDELVKFTKSVNAKK